MKLKALLGFILLLTTSAFGQAVFTDTFARANGAIGSNYSVQGVASPAWSVSSDTAIDSSGYASAIYTGASLNNNQYTTTQQGTYAVNSVGACSRYTAGGSYGSGYCWKPQTVSSGKMTAAYFGATSTMNPTATSVTGLSVGATDTVTIAEYGTTVYFIVDGTIKSTMTSSTYTSGNGAMISGGGTFTSTYGFTHFEVGNYSGPQTAPPTASPVAGVYFATPQSVTLTDAGATICYTLDGSTPSTNGAGTCTTTNPSTNTYSTAISVSSTETINAVGTSSGNSDSARQSFTYTIPPADTAVATDNFSSYYNYNLESSANGETGATNLAGQPFQYPLDLWTTGSAWQSVGGLANYVTVGLDSTRGAGTFQVIAGGVGTAAGVIERTKEGYYTNQASEINLEAITDYSSAVAVRCSTSHCYYLSIIASPNTATFGDYFGSAIASATVGTLTGTHTLELRVVGCTFYPLLDGVVISGIGQQTVLGCATTGQPGVIVQNGAVAYNWSGFNIGGTYSGSYTPPTPTYSTYSFAFNTSSDSFAAPWFQGSAGSAWPGTLGAVSTYSGGYAAGDTNSSGNGVQMEYRAPFGVNQWLAATWQVRPWDSRTDNYFTPLLHQAVVPGFGGSYTKAVDLIGIYPGIEQVAAANVSCSTPGKSEYICTPWWHITEVDPVNSPTNQVNTLTGSTTTLLPGDQIEVRVVNGWVDAFCKQSSTPLTSWSAGMTITAGTTYIEADGIVWLATTSGTAGSTQPSWPASSATWNSSTNTGTYVTDGTGVWMYQGDTCPSPTVYTRIMHVYFPYLSNPASTASTGNGTSGQLPNPLSSPLGVGFPTIWAQGVAPFPFVNNVSMGTVQSGSGEPCATPGACIIPAGMGLEIEDE